MESLKNFLSGIGKVILYNAKALLDGEHGKVVDVENLGPYDPKTLEYRMYIKDDFGNLPPLVTFENPLGKKVERIPKQVLEKSFDPKTEKVDYSWVYPEYNIGDNYP